MAKAHPERVDVTCALRAIRDPNCTDPGQGWTHYIIAHYRATGQLPPGCDARDFYAWWDRYNGRRLEHGMGVNYGS